MATIDERIVSVKFDNAQFEKGVKGTMKSLDEFEKNLEMKDGIKGFKALIDNLGKVDFSKMANNVEKLTSRFTNLGIMGAAALQKITHQAMNVGTALIKSLTVDQVSAGFTKYEQKTAALQTIMAATGKKIEDVNSELERLTWFTDETSYSFTDMVSNIGKFTSQNVGLKTSVTAMQGIANWAALSGQGVGEASRAMYNLSQALGKGSVQLIDWKSIENANMATTEFKQTAIDTAKELGILNKETAKTVKGHEVNTTNFNEYLKDEWFTTEVLIATLSKYGDYADEVFKMASERGITAAEAMELLGENTGGLGEKAFKAAQQAKTFTDVINATKDAVSSGWMQTFEHVFGNYEEAVVLWSDLAQQMWELFAEGAETRNKTLEKWKETGGRDDMISGLMDIVEAIKNIKTAATDIFGRVFPPLTAKNLKEISKHVKNIGVHLKEATSYIEVEGSGIFDTVKTKITKTGKALDEAFSGRLLKKGVKDLDGDLKTFQERLSKVSGEDLGDEIAKGIFGPKTKKALKDFQKEHGLVVDGIYGPKTHAALLESLGVTDTTVIQFRRVERQLKVFGSTVQKIQNIFGGAMAVIGIGIKVFKFLWSVVKVVSKALEPLGHALLTIGSAIGALLMDFNDWLGEGTLFSDWLDTITKKLEPFAEWVKTASNELLKFFGLDGGEKIEGELSPFQKKWEELKKSFNENEGIKSLKASFNKIKEEFKKIGPILKEYWTKAKEYLGEKFTESWERIKAKLPEILEKIGNGIAWFIDFITPYVQKIPGLLIKIKDFFVGLWETTDENGNKTPGFLQNAFNWIKDIYTQLRASENLQEVLGKLKQIFLDIGAAIKEFFGSFGAGSETDATGVEKGITVGDKLKEALAPGGVFDSILNFVNDFASRVAVIAKKLGPGGLITLLAVIFGAWKFFKMIKSFGGIAESIGGAFDALKERLRGGSRVQKIGTTILQFAIAVGILAAAIYFVGKMDWDVFKRGVGTLSAIVGAIVAMVWITSRLPEEKTKGLANVGKAILQFAIAVGILVAAVYILGSMDRNTLLQGGIALLVLFGFIAMFTQAAKSMDIKVQFKGLISMAIAIGILVGIVWLISKMDFRSFASGFLGLTAIVGLLAGLGWALKSTNGSLNVSFKGLIGMAIAIGILVGIINIISGMDFMSFVGGFLGLIFVMGALAAFMKAMDKLDNSNIKIVGLLAMVGAIAILVGCVKTLAEIHPGKALLAVLGIIGIMSGLILMTRAMEKMKKIKWSSIFKMLAPALVIAGLLFVLSKAVARIKDVDTRKILAFVGGLSLLMGIMTLFTRFGGTSNPLTMVSQFVSMLGLMGIVIAISYALSQLKDVDTSKIVAFTGGLTTLMVGLGGFLLMAAAAGATGPAVWIGMAAAFVALIAFLGILAGVIYAIGKIAQDPVLSKISEDAFALIGRCIGTLSGEMRAADIKAFGQAMEGFDGFTIDEEGLKQATKAMESLLELSNVLPDVHFMSRIGDWIAGSKTKNFAADIVFLTNGLSAYATEVGKMENVSDLSGKTFTLVSVAKALKTLSDLLPEVHFMSKIADWIGGSEMKNFSADITTFVKTMSGYATELSEMQEVPDIGEKTTALVDIAKSISKLEQGLEPASKMPKLFSWAGLVGPTSMQSFVQNMENFARGMSEISRLFTDNEFDKSFVTESKYAVEGAKAITEFEKKLPVNTGMPKLFVWSGLVGPTKMESFSDNMKNFAAGISSISKVFKDYTIDKGFVTNSQNAVDGAKAIVEFEKGLPEAPGTWKVVAWATSSTKMESLADNLREFASGISAMSNALSLGDFDIKFVTKTTNAVLAAHSIVLFDQLLPKPPDTWKAVSWATGPTSMESLAKNMEDFARGISALVSALPEGDLDMPGKTKSAIDAAKDIIAFDDDLTIPADPWPNFAKFLQGSSSMDVLKEKLIAFSTGIDSLVSAVDDISLDGENGFNAKVGAAKTAAETIAGFDSALPVASGMPNLLSFLEGPSSMESFKDDLVAFSDGISLWAEALAPINATNLPWKTGKAVEAMTAISNFLGELNDTELQKKLDQRSGLEKFLNMGTNNSDSLATMMTKLSSSIKQVASDFEQVEGVDTKTEVVKRALTSFADLLHELATNDNLQAEQTDLTSMTMAMTNFDQIMKDLISLGASINRFQMDTRSIDTEAFSAIMSGIESLATAINLIKNMETTEVIDSIATIQVAIDTLSKLFTGSDKKAKIKPEEFLNGLDAEAIATKIKESAMTIGTAVSEATSTVTSSTDAFNTAGAGVGSAIATGIGSNASEATGAVSTLISDAKTAGRNEAAKFFEVGKAMCTGIAAGLRNNARIATMAAGKVALDALQAAKDAILSRSPAKKFIELGESADDGLAIGFNNKSKMVQNSSSGVVEGALESAKKALSHFASILATDMDADPVIRPVVDLTDVKSGAQEISNLMNAQRSFSLAASTSQHLARTVGTTPNNESRQNGGVSPESSPIMLTDPGVMVTGNEFIIRSDNDIRLLASELASHTKMGQRALGATT